MKKSNEVSLKDALKDMVEHYRLSAKLNQARIRQVWTETMGTSIARYTTELKIRKRTLYVSITSAPLRQELSYGKEHIKTIINEALGEAFIDEVVVR